MGNDYATAWDALCEAIGAAKGQSTTVFDDQDHLTTDQRLKACEIAALLSIAQELSALNPRSNQYRDESDVIRNGWGLKTHLDRFDIGD